MKAKWILQTNIFKEEAVDHMLRALKILDYPHDLVKIIPFSDNLPEGITPYDGPVIAYGTTTLLRNIIKIESTNKQIIILGKEKIDIESEYMYNVINLSGKTKLEEIPEIISLCDYVYTTDSGVLHIAGILEIPTRSFFGSIDSKLRTGLYKENEKNKIYCKKELPCVPCNDVGCSEIYCMKYTEEEVEKIIND